MLEDISVKVPKGAVSGNLIKITRKCDPSEEHIYTGMECKIKDIVGKAAAELNGKIATIIVWDSDALNWSVQVTDGPAILLPAANFDW